jgi:outer membrane receptor protein involved in Fe transport
MSITFTGLKAGLLSTTFLGVNALGLICASHAQAQTVAPSADAPASPTEVVVTLQKKTRSSVDLAGSELQKIQPGINSLKAIQTLPGVLFETADPWGNNEQNETLYIHGFSLQQLGYTFDDVPLGDQQYGNWNGLSPNRAVTSENISRVTLSSGAADLGTASTSNLGGAVETYSIDPSKDMGGAFAQTLGSYQTTRTFLRLESGDFGNGNSAYVSVLHHDQRAWDFNGHQRDDQLNAKFVHQGDKGRLTAYVDWSYKVEPNEDSIVHPETGSSATPATADTGVPYTRPFLYPNYVDGLNYLSCSTTCAPPTSAGNNFSNYDSAAQRQDDLAYVKYDYRFNDHMSWSNQAYYHYDYGRGIVAGPINQAGLPALFSVYYPGQNLQSLFGGTGYAVRTTEYLINRAGGISTFKWHNETHNIEAGLWIEDEFSTQHRAWYPFSAANNDLSPYSVPTGAKFDQYYGRFNDEVMVFHIQDQWRLTSNLLLQYGFKSSSQDGSGWFPINQKNAATGTQTVYPQGTIRTHKGFLPQVGLVWDATPHDQIFMDAQQNVRQFIVYGAGGSAWSLPSQSAFDLFKANTKPETSTTYEAGWRFHYTFNNLGPVTAFEGQVNAYHVDFQNRLLQISSTPVILSLVSGAAILANVGNVKTDGMDLAGTLHFGPHVSFYDAVSYNKSIYQNNYTTGAANTVVPTAGKFVPGEPEWMNKSVLSTNFGAFDAQLIGDYVGKRYATYTNDLSVKSYFLTSLEAGYRFDLLKGSKISLNVQNLGNIKGWSTVVVGAASGTYNTYPIPPRQYFVTLSSKF